MLEALVVDKGIPAARDIHIRLSDIEAHHPERRCIAALTSLDGKVRRARLMLIARVPVHIASEVRKVRSVVKGERGVLREPVPCADADDIRKRVKCIDIVPRAVRRAERVRTAAERAQIERRNAEIRCDLVAHLHICRLLDRGDTVALKDSADLQDKITRMFQQIERQSTLVLRSPIIIINQIVDDSLTEM